MKTSDMLHPSTFFCHFDTYFPRTQRATRNLRYARPSRPQFAEAYGTVAANAIVETLFLLPKVALGSGAAISPHQSLRPGQLNMQERGVVGCVSLAAGLLTQFGSLAIGAALGFAACALGTLVGAKLGDWPMYGTAKGLQLGTLVGTCLMMPSELTRGLMHAAMPAALELVRPLAYAGNLLGQIADIFTAMPNSLVDAEG